MKVFIVGAVAVLCFTPAYSSIIRGNGQQYINSDGLGKDNLEAVQQYQPTNGWEVVSQLINCVNEKLQSLEEVFNQFKTVFPVELGKTYPDYNNQGPIAGRAVGTVTGTGAPGGAGGGGSTFESNIEGTDSGSHSGGLANLDHDSIANNLLAGSLNQLQLLSSGATIKGRSGGGDQIFDSSVNGIDAGSHFGLINVDHSTILDQLAAGSLNQAQILASDAVNVKGRSHGQSDKQKKEEKLNHEITKLLTAGLIASNMKEKFEEEEKAKEEEEERRIELQRKLVAAQLLAEAVNQGGSGSGHKSSNHKSGISQSNNNAANNNIGHQFSSSQSNSARVQQEKAELEKIQQLQNLLAISNVGQDVNVNTAGFNSGPTSQAAHNRAGNINSNNKVTLENFMNQLQSQSSKINGVGGNVNIGQKRAGNSLSSNKLEFGNFNDNPNMQMTFLNALKQSTVNQGGNRDDDDDDLLGRGDVKHVEKEASTAQLIAQIMEDMNGQKAVQGRSRSEKQDINNLIISQEINDIKNRIQDQLTEDSNGFDGQSFADGNQNMINVLGTANSLSNVGNHHSRQIGNHDTGIGDNDNIGRQILNHDMGNGNNDNIGRQIGNDDMGNGNNDNILRQIGNNDMGNGNNDDFLRRVLSNNKVNALNDNEKNQGALIGALFQRQLSNDGGNTENFNVDPNSDQTFRFQGRSYDNSPATYPGVAPYMAYSSGYDQYAPVQPAYQNVFGGYPAGVAYGPVYPANPGYQQPAYY